MAAEEVTYRRSDVPSESTTQEVHLPRVFAQDSCLEHCGKLGQVAGQALLEAVSDPGHQIDVVCLGRRMLGICGADTRRAGIYSDHAGTPIEGTDEKFLPNPMRYSETKYSTIRSEIEAVIEQGGSAHHILEIKKGPWHNSV